MKTAALTLTLLATLFSGQTLAGGGDTNIGINGASCSFESISAAIAAADSGDEIFLSPGFYSQVLFVVDKSLTFVPAHSGSNCQTEDPLANRALYTISAAGGSQSATGGLGEITGGAQVTFRNMTLRDATATNGGILAVTNGSVLILDGSIVQGGEASGSGGNIYALGEVNQPSEVQLINGAWVRDGRSGGDGGGIALFASNLIVQNGRIGSLLVTEQNFAEGNGGGVAAFSSTVSLTSPNARLTGNTSENGGGGLFSLDSTVELTDAVVTNNSAISDGGGLRIAGGALTVTNATLSENRLPEDFDDAPSVLNDSRGGAIFIADAMLVVDNTEFSSNRAAQGGGISGGENSTIVVRNNVRFIDNKASSIGGGISASGTLDVINSEFTSNGASGGGGAVACGVATLSDVHFTDNAARFGGAISFRSDMAVQSATNVIESATFDSNRAVPDAPSSAAGGAIAASGVSFVVSNSEFRENRATSRGASGGAISAFQLNDDVQMTVRILSSDFFDNEATVSLLNEGGGGGAVRVSRNVELTLTDVVFDGNSTNLNGGALLLSNEATFATNVHFRDNAAGILGGALHAEGGAIAMTSDFSLCDQSALPANEYCAEMVANTALAGGGAYLVDMATSISHMAFQANSANDVSTPFIGAALMVAESGNLDVNNSLFALNTGQLQDTGIIASTSETNETEIDITIRSSSIVDNNGAALVSDTRSASWLIENSLVHGNAFGPNLPRFSMVDTLCNNSQLPYDSDISIGDNLGTPIFDTNNPRGDYRLTAFSPGVDRCSSGPPTDLDGLFRAGAGTAFDQGAFEFGGNLQPMEMIFADGFEM